MEERGLRQAPERPPADRKLPPNPGRLIPLTGRGSACSPQVIEHGHKLGYTYRYHIVVMSVGTKVWNAVGPQLNSTCLGIDARSE